MYLPFLVVFQHVPPRKVEWNVERSMLVYNVHSRHFDAHWGLLFSIADICEGRKAWQRCTKNHNCQYISELICCMMFQVIFRIDIYIDRFEHNYGLCQLFLCRMICEHGFNVKEGFMRSFANVVSTMNKWCITMIWTMVGKWP
jgi:hypothetical protein